jgi:D-alanyl-D-alanine dipeptidase
MINTSNIDFRYPQKDKKGEWKIVTFWLERNAAKQAEKARNECLRRFGAPLIVTDAGRTHQQQVNLFAAKPKLAAHPGKSFHEAGAALDVDMGHLNALTGSQAKSEKFLAEFGFVRTCWETWHFEYHGLFQHKDVKKAIAYIENN